MLLKASALSSMLFGSFSPFRAQEDLAAVQQKRQQLHALRQDVRNFQAEIEANVRRAEAELQAAREREEETRGIKVRLAEEVRQQQAEIEEREQRAREAEQYRESMAAHREVGERGRNFLALLWRYAFSSSI